MVAHASRVRDVQGAQGLKAINAGGTPALPMRCFSGAVVNVVPKAESHGGVGVSTALAPVLLFIPPTDRSFLLRTVHSIYGLFL
jgi:hypothetical protein